MDEPTAIPYEPRTSLHRFRLSRLLVKRAVVRTPFNTLFLDQAEYIAYREGPRRTFIIIGIALLLLWYDEIKPKPNERPHETPSSCSILPVTPTGRDELNKKLPVAFASAV